MIRFSRRISVIVFTFLLLAAALFGSPVPSPIVNDGSNADNLVQLTSTNAGATWAQSTASLEYWTATASSADGNKLVVAGNASRSTGVMARPFPRRSEAKGQTPPALSTVSPSPKEQSAVFEGANQRNSWKREAAIR